ncbi:MAG: exo-alpha-sialidase [Oscillospiraceae bacterium]|nr:exo-alpha-sialidase [Oscillospiraceae bacterium]
MSYLVIEHDSYTVEFDTPEVYVDNKARDRSGHMTHAMAEFAPGKYINFNANCSAYRSSGHSVYGWVEYRIFENGVGSKVYELPYAKKSFLDGLCAISVEKAVACDDGTIAALCLRNTMATELCCEPWDTPTCIRSTDGGLTWSEPFECIPYRGRIYDALYRDGVIYVLIFCNEHFLGSAPEHVYRLYKSTDNGLSFEEVSVIPFDTLRRGYGSILFDDAGVLHAYAYNESAEREMDHAISTDCGVTWTVCAPCYLAEGIRNPQTALIDGVYILHGRAEDWKGLVFYTSENGQDWDEGSYLVRKKALCYYSNNLNLRDEQGNYLLVQYSDAYDGYAAVNVMHAKLRVRRKCPDQASRP